MEKVKTLVKSLDCDMGFVNLKMSLLRGDENNASNICDYAIIAETDTDLSFVRIGNDKKMAEYLFDLFYENDVMPRTINDIVRDIVSERYACM